MVRQVSKKKHIIAASLAIAIFLMGLFLGVIVNKQRAAVTGQKTEISKLDYDSLQVQYLFLTSILENEENCVAASKALEENINELGILGNKLDSYMRDQAIFNEESFRTLKREYILAELRYWLFAKKVKAVCKGDGVSILYFYSDIVCDKCRTQGVILSYLKGKLEDKLLNFALDFDFVQEPMINILKTSYGITTIPTLVIDEKKYEGFYTEEELLYIICPLYKEKLTVCEDKGE